MPRSTEYTLNRMRSSVRRMLRTLDTCDIAELNSDDARPVHVATDAGMPDTEKIGRYCPHHTSNPDVAFIAELRKLAIQMERTIMRADKYSSPVREAK